MEGAGRALGLLACFRLLEHGACQRGIVRAIRRTRKAFLQRAIVLQNGSSQCGQSRPAAFGAAGRGFDQGFSPAAVHGIDQQPRAAVAHVHRARCAGNGACAVDRIEQVGLAGAHGNLVATVELDLQFEALHWRQVIGAVGGVATCFGGN